MVTDGYTSSLMIKTAQKRGAKTAISPLEAKLLLLAPAVLLSGFMSLIANMPDVVQALTYFNALRYFLVIIEESF